MPEFIVAAKLENGMGKSFRCVGDEGVYPIHEVHPLGRD